MQRCALTQAGQHLLQLCSVFSEFQNQSYQGDSNRFSGRNSCLVCHGVAQFPYKALLGVSGADILLQGGLQIGASSKRIPGEPSSVIMSPLSAIMSTDGLK